MQKVLRFSPVEKTSFILPAATVYFAIGIWVLVRQGKVALLIALDNLAAHTTLALAVSSVSSVAFIFVLAHILDTVSSSIYERFLSDNLHGFPHERLVPPREATRRHQKFLEMHRARQVTPRFLYEGVKVVSFSGLLLILIGIGLRHPSIERHLQIQTFLQWLNSYLLLVLSFTTILIAVPYVFLKYFPGRVDPRESRTRAHRIFKAIQKGLRIGGAHLFVGGLVTIFVRLPCKLNDAFDRFIRAAFRLDEPLDVDTYAKIVEVVHQRTTLEFHNLQTNDRFWIPFLLLIENSKRAGQHAVEAWNKATFCRNQALALLLASMLLVSAYRHQPGSRDIPGFLTRDDIWALSLFCFCASQFFCYRFYQNHYSFTKLVFRAVASMSLERGKRKTSSGDKVSALAESCDAGSEAKQ